MANEACMMKALNLLSTQHIIGLKNASHATNCRLYGMVRVVSP